MRLALPVALALAVLPAPAHALQSVAGQSVAGDSAVERPAAGPRLSEAEEARARSLEGRLKCPVCRTQSVLESTSFMALEMRAKIRELIAAGRSDAEILDYFADRYGDYILLEPRKRGFGLSAYALPALVVLAGGVFVALWVRRRSRLAALASETVMSTRAGPEPESPSDAVAGGPLSAEDRERVEQELKRYIV
jgi:cytochrome c-type biogenesis protein CcmH